MTHTESEAADPLLKADVLGLALTPSARREAVLAEFERSGMSGRMFAAFIGINYQTFAT